MHAHDLARQGKANARPIAFGGEKGDEDVLLHIFQNPGAIVPHADNHMPAVIEVGREIHAGIGATCKGLHRISHQVDQHLFHEIRIRSEFEGLGGDGRVNAHIVLVAFGLHQKNNPGKEFGNLKNLKIRARDARELAIGFDKVEQALAARLNGLQCHMNIGQGFGIDSRGPLCIRQETAHRRGERRNRGDGVHDFMRQNADEFLPRLHFLFFEFALDILNRRQNKRFAPHPKFCGIDDDLEHFILVLHLD